MLSGKGCGISKTTRMLAQKQPSIQRVRNSSLVERGPAPKMSGAEARNVRNMIPKQKNRKVGRGALSAGRSCTMEGAVDRRENAGMSSENKVRILVAEYPRFPE